MTGQTVKDFIEIEAKKYIDKGYSAEKAEKQAQINLKVNRHYKNEWKMMFIGGAANDEYVDIKNIEGTLVIEEGVLMFKSPELYIVVDDNHDAIYKMKETLEKIAQEQKQSIYLFVETKNYQSVFASWKA